MEKDDIRFSEEEYEEISEEERKRIDEGIAQLESGEYVEEIL